MKITKEIYLWYVSKKIPKLGEFVNTVDININKVVNYNAGVKGQQVSLLFLKTQKVFTNLYGYERFLKPYYKQEESRYVPMSDPRRLLAGRLLRKIQRKIKIEKILVAKNK